jgi:hypothetical protein
MMRPKRHRNRSVLTLSALVVSGALVACGEEPPPVVTAPPPPPKPTAPPPPPVTSIADLMAKYDIDQRVNLPEELAPDTDVQRIAVLKFFDAFARGNSEALGEWMSSEDKAELTRLVESGAFKSTTDTITRIDLRCQKKAAMAVFHTGETFQPQLWAYFPQNDSAEWQSFASPPDILNKVSGENPIDAWADIVKAEMQKADEPDVVLEIPQKDFTTIETASTGEGGGGEAPTGPTGPSAPGGAPGKRAPGAPIKAPKPPGFGQQ